MTVVSGWRDILTTGLDVVDIADLRDRVRDTLASSDAPPCTVHPVGFFHFAIAKEGAATVRLHYWPAANRATPTAVTPYHDHVWRLESTVIAGRLTNVMIALAADSDGPFNVADIAQDGRIDAIAPAEERVRIVAEEEDHFTTGDRYTIEPRQFHYTVAPAAGYALTVVRSVAAVAGGPRTLVPVGHPGHAPSRPFLRADKARAVREEIIGVLAAN